MSSALRGHPSIGTGGIGGGLDFFFFLLVVFFKSAHGSLNRRGCAESKPGSGFGRFTGGFLADVRRDDPGRARFPITFLRGEKAPKVWNLFPKERLDFTDVYVLPGFLVQKG